MLSTRAELDLQRKPAHCGIPGNVEEDELAKAVQTSSNFILPRALSSQSTPKRIYADELLRRKLKTRA